MHVVTLHNLGYMKSSGVHGVGALLPFIAFRRTQTETTVPLVLYAKK